MRTIKQRMGRRARESSNQPLAESLESRLLMSGTVTLGVANGLLTITGDASDNSIMIEDTGVGTFDVTGTNGTSISYSGAHAPDTAVSVTLAKALTIDFSQGGNDRVDAVNKLVLTDATGDRYAFTYTGGAGNDTLFAPTGATGMIAAMDATANVSEVQLLTFSGTPADGDFTITLGETELNPIAYDAVGSEVQRLVFTGVATEGDYTITLGAAETDAIAYDATAGDIQTALEALDDMSGKVTVSGDSTTGFAVTFDTSLDAQPLMVIDSAMANDDGSVDVTVTTAAPKGLGGAILSELESIGALAGKVVITGDATDGFTVTFDSSLGQMPVMTAASTMVDGDEADVDVNIVQDTPGSRLGASAAGSITIDEVAATAATGSVTFAANAKNGDRFTLNDGQGNVRNYTAVLGTPNRALGQFKVLSTAALTMADLITTINTGPALEITALVDGNNSAKCNLTNDNLGATGNQTIIVSAFSVTRIKVTAMTGGANTNAEAGNTVELDDSYNTMTFTFGVGAGKVPIGATKQISAANLATAINEVGSGLLITAVDNGDGTITLVQDFAGTDGNTTITVTGNNLDKEDFAGGVDGTNVSDGDTIVITDGENDPVTFTARTTPVADTDFEIGGSAGRSMANLVAAINALYEDEGIRASAVDNFDGTCTVTNDVAGLQGNVEMVAEGWNFASTGLEGGLGGGIDCLSYTVTTGAGTNFVGIGSTAAGQSYVFGNVSITGGAGDETVEMYGVYVLGTTTIGLAASAANDVVTITDEGTVSSLLSGNVSITQAAGKSTITLEDNTAGTLVLGGNLTITVGDTAAGVAVTTLDNVWVDGQFSYTGGVGNEEIELLNGVLVADLATINMSGTGTTIAVGAGTSMLNAPQGFSVGSLTGGALAYYGGAGDDTVVMSTASTHKGNATFSMGDGANSLTIGEGEVDGSFTYTGGAGTDTVDIGATSFMQRGAFTMTGGAGNNALTLDNANVHGFTYTGGANDDTLIIGETAFVDTSTFSVNGNATSTYAAANADAANSLTMDNAIIVGNMTYSAGAGADTVSIGGASVAATGSITLDSTVADDSFILNDGHGNVRTYTAVDEDPDRSIGQFLVGDTDADTMADLILTINQGPTLGITAAVDPDDDTSCILTNDVVGAAGNQEILVWAASAATISATNMTGGDVDSFDGRGTITLTPGNGVNSITIDGRSRAVSYTGGSAADTLKVGTLSPTGYTLDGDLTFAVGTGGGDQLDFDGTLRNLSYAGGAGLDTYNLGVGAAGLFSARGNVSIAGFGGAVPTGGTLSTAANGGASAGTIKNAAIRGTFTLTGSDGIDTLNVGQDAGTGMKVGKGVTMTLNAGDDIVRVDDSIFNQVSGVTSINTGAGADTIELDVAGTSKTVFYGKTTFTNTTGIDIFNDRAVGGTHGTYYMAGASANKPTFAAYWSTSSVLNGDNTNGTIIGSALIAPSYT